MINKIKALLLTILVTVDSATINDKQCTSAGPEKPLFVTSDCIDPMYHSPTIIDEVDINASIPYHKVRAQFDGTDEKFNIYLPPKSMWQGRFFQLAYPSQDENADQETIAFGADSGAFTVQASGTPGYRPDAAAAKFARTVAANYYDDSREIYGYFYGGSGGSYQVVGGIENTVGVWQGAVPMIQAVPVSIPLNAAVRSLAALVLKDKANELAHTVSPGGNRSMDFLNEDEKAILTEATSLGLVPRAWENYTYNSNAFLLTLFSSTVKGQDPTYADDFWSKPGYAGAESSFLGDIFRASKIDTSTIIQQVHRNETGFPINITLGEIPDITNALGLDFNLYSVNNSLIGAVMGSLDSAETVLILSDTTIPSVLEALSEGMTIGIDNRWFLALHTYYRHQAPKRPGFYGFDHLLGRDGKPLYPQRGVEVAPRIAANSSGRGTHTGKINGKMIVVSNLLDVDAFPWHADWYKNQVQNALGEDFDDNYRIWFNDNADHNFGPVTGVQASRLVDFTGIYQQALRDLSAWVEQGSPPASSSGYTVSDSQIILDETAVGRRGVQPVVNLLVNNQETVRVSRKNVVQLNASVQIPPNVGQVVSMEWDCLGTGAFNQAPFETGSPNRAETECIYEKPGTYFPAVRVTAKRDKESPFGKIPNLGRARVIVT